MFTSSTESKTWANDFTGKDGKPITKNAKLTAPRPGDQGSSNKKAECVRKEIGKETGCWLCRWLHTIRTAF